MVKGGTVKEINTRFAKRSSESYRPSTLRPGARHLVMKSIYCVDGKLNMSIQASREHASTPKTDEGPYTHVEVGFPSLPPPASWKEYCKGGKFDKAPCDSVYEFVPLELVAEWIDEHGGIKPEVAPKLVLPSQGKQKPDGGSAKKERPTPTAKDLGFPPDAGGKE